MGRRKKPKDSIAAKRSPTGGALGGTLVRPQSRRTSCPKLRSLNCFPEVHERICQGWPASKLAEWIQEDKKEYLDAERVTVVKVLQRYRASLPAAELSKHTLPKAHIQAIEQVGDDIDEVQEMIRLYRRQLKRIDIDSKVEESIGKLIGSTMTQDVRLTMDMLVKVAQLKMDLGINERHLGVVDVETAIIDGVDQRYEGTDIGKVIQDPKKRRRLINIAEHALALSKRGVDLDALDDAPAEPEQGVVVSADQDQ